MRSFPLLLVHLTIRIFLINLILRLHIIKSISIKIFKLILKCHLSNLAWSFLFHYRLSLPIFTNFYAFLSKFRIFACSGFYCFYINYLAMVLRGFLDLIVLIFNIAFIFGNIEDTFYLLMVIRLFLWIFQSQLIKWQYYHDHHISP